MYKEIIESCQNVNDSAKIKLSIVGKVKYKGMANGTPNPSSVSGNNYTWHIKDLLNFGNQLDLYFKTDTNATSADTIVVIAEIIPFGKDKDSTNNKLKFIYKVRNSYDPNIKQTYPETVLPNYNDWLYYIIQFQNTGTAPAYNIRLEDTLDSYLNYETLQLIDYSHSNRMILNNKVLKFYFDDIMLPDSFSDSKGSNGFVQYRIKPKSNLPLGTKIYNTAYIYFDYNSPVITNTTINEYAQPKGNGIKAIVRDGLTIYPNPGHGLYNIQLSNNSSTKLTVFNSIGQVIKTLDIKNQTVLDLNAFANGIYFISIEQGDKIFHAKVVKE
ncbi:MAG: T9SS type A sorting domain-containing protein [bacterium]|nr:T9SS type A sorting domain-containing protein [bacterium]